MRDETAAWLEPMLTEAEQRDVDIKSLMTQATMPAAETSDPAIEAMAHLDPEVRGIDWVRFGELLRRELGWDTYPADPQ
ncbi:hypothetical protein [Mycobacterium sp. E2238]|uniref:hypothetical protein n=1 Tax=Mycobacterium sp. E2238 TaxID=1834131 RepID=UPI00080163CA|nr:hypothetical protein [Mycobacterium sp. E2238]OBI33762.1 hypothetical protein A5711_18165 [Mycobacterium sp. E2238]